MLGKPIFSRPRNKGEKISCINFQKSYNLKRLIQINRKQELLILQMTILNSRNERKNLKNGNQSNARRRRSRNKEVKETLIIKKKLKREFYLKSIVRNESRSLRLNSRRKRWKRIKSNKILSCQNKLTLKLILNRLISKVKNTNVQRMVQILINSI